MGIVDDKNEKKFNANKREKIIARSSNALPHAMPRFHLALSRLHSRTSLQFSFSPLLAKLLGSSLLRQFLAALLPRPNQLEMSRPLAQQRLRLSHHA